MRGVCARLWQQLCIARLAAKQQNGRWLVTAQESNTHAKNVEKAGVYGPKLTTGRNIMVDGKAVRLDRLIETTGDFDWWWATTLFVKPSVVLVKINRHLFYKELHTRTV